MACGISGYSVEILFVGLDIVIVIGKFLWSRGFENFFCGTVIYLSVVYCFVVNGSKKEIKERCGRIVEPSYF